MSVDETAVRFTDHNKTVPVVIDDDLRASATRFVEQTREIEYSLL